MLPTLLEGQSVLVDTRIYATGQPVVGDVVLLRHPLDPNMDLVKRVQSVAEGKVFVVGDNPDVSADSRQFGPVPLGSISGKVISTFP